jgi:hypothetical protein
MNDPQTIRHRGDITMWAEAAMRVAWVLVTCLSFAACAKSSTSSTPQPEPEGAARFSDALSRVADIDFCGEGSTDEVAFDARTAAGFSADDVLAYAAGTHEERLTWQVVESPEEQGEVAVGPESGTRALSITVEPRGDAARFHVPSAGVIGHGLVCEPWLEIDVRVIVRSQGGALLEGFDATLVSQKGAFAYVSATSDGGSPLAQGELSVGRPGNTLAGIELRFVFTPYGVTGTLLARWAESPYESELAHFGKAHCAKGHFALSLDDDLEGTSARELVRERGTHDDLPGSWDGGTAVNASIALALTDDTTVCGLEVDWGVDQVGFDLAVSGEVTLTTEDGRLDETMPGSLGLTIGDPMRADDFYLNGTTTWQPAGSTPLDLVPPDDLERFSAVTLSVSVYRDSFGSAGGIQVRGEKPSICTEPLADGTCPDWEPLAAADLRP